MVYLYVYTTPAATRQLSVPAARPMIHSFLLALNILHELYPAILN